MVAQLQYLRYPHKTLNIHPSHTIILIFVIIRQVQFKHTVSSTYPQRQSKRSPHILGNTIKTYIIQNTEQKQQTQQNVITILCTNRLVGISWSAIILIQQQQTNNRYEIVECIPLENITDVRFQQINQKNKVHQQLIKKNNNNNDNDLKVYDYPMNKQILNKSAIIMSMNSTSKFDNQSPNTIQFKQQKYQLQLKLNTHKNKPILKFSILTMSSINKNKIKQQSQKQYALGDILNDMRDYIKLQAFRKNNKKDQEHQLIQLIQLISQNMENATDCDLIDYYKKLLAQKIALQFA